MTAAQQAVVFGLLLVAASCANTCPSMLANTCAEIPPMAVYDQGEGTLADCCANCVADQTLCYAYVWTAAAKRAMVGQCAMVDVPLTSTHQGNCTVGIMPGRLPKAPPTAPAAAPKGAKNVLFLIADDMRPSVTPYATPGKQLFSTPAMDELAATGITFARAYVQIAYCAPSRNSFMSGRRPDAIHVHSFIGTFRDPSTGQNYT